MVAKDPLGSVAEGWITFGASDRAGPRWLLDRITENDRYPLSARIKALREIRARLNLLTGGKQVSAPPRQYEPSRGRYKRRR